jgi:hypothetical protein
MTMRYMRYLATGLVTPLLSLPALSVELFRYRVGAGGSVLKQSGFVNLQRQVSRCP